MIGLFVSFVFGIFAISFARLGKAAPERGYNVVALILLIGCVLLAFEAGRWS